MKRKEARGKKQDKKIKREKSNNLQLLIKICASVAKKREREKKQEVRNKRKEQQLTAIN